MSRDCIKPWEFMCVARPDKIIESCGFRACENDRIHACEEPQWILYIDIVGLLRAAK